MIDTNLNTWLIEINSSPAMDYSTVKYTQAITEILVKKVMEDIIKVTVDYNNNPLADTGDFELCYCQKKITKQFSVLIIL